ncbi:MAG: hypothetical protein ISS55_08050 [Dehalococcoidales bacterium]|nr:hypothetical protein [Dehalococcoidales bacterium]
MKQQLITAIKAIIVIVLIVVAITSGTQLYTSTLHDDTQGLQRFADDARRFHDKVEGSALLEGFHALHQRVLDEIPENSPEVNTLVVERALSAQGYTNQFTRLPLVTAGLELLSSLQREGQLLQSCYAKLRLAWSEKESGHESAFISYCEESRRLFDEARLLREENSAELERILSGTKVEQED